MIFTSLYEYNSFSWCLLGILCKTVLNYEVPSLKYTLFSMGSAILLFVWGCQGHLDELKRRDVYYCELYQFA